MNKVCALGTREAKMSEEEDQHQFEVETYHDVEDYYADEEDHIHQDSAGYEDYVNSTSPVLVPFATDDVKEWKQLILVMSELLQSLLRDHGLTTDRWLAEFTQELTHTTKYDDIIGAIISRWNLSNVTDMPEARFLLAYVFKLLATLADEELARRRNQRGNILSRTLKAVAGCFVSSLPMFVSRVAMCSAACLFGGTAGFMLNRRITR